MKNHTFHIRLIHVLSGEQAKAKIEAPDFEQALRLFNKIGAPRGYKIADNQKETAHEPINA